MSRDQAEAKRLRRKRLIFERSLSNRISMAEAARQIDAEARQERLRARTVRADADRDRTPPPARQAQFYWQKGQYE